MARTKGYRGSLGKYVYVSLNNSEFEYIEAVAAIKNVSPAEIIRQFIDDIMTNDSNIKRKISGYKKLQKLSNLDAKPPT